MTNPLRPSPSAANTGSVAMRESGARGAGTPRWELGYVLEYDPSTHTAAVGTQGGSKLVGVPQIKGTSGSYDHLAAGTTVVLTWDLGFPVIVGCMDFAGNGRSQIPPFTITGVSGVGSEDPTHPPRDGGNHKPQNAPTDLMPGDWAHVGSLGNHVAVLEGGIASLGSPSAMVQSLGTSGTLRTVARRIQQFTDFGKLKIENEGGKTSLTLLAGSKSATQTGADEQHWTISLMLGAAGDVFDFKIAAPEGRLLFRMHAGSDGRVEIYGDGGVDISSGANGTATLRHDVVGQRSVNVTGDQTTTIQGEHVHRVNGESTVVVVGATTCSTGGDHTQFTVGNQDVGVGGDETYVVAGTRTTRLGGDDKTDVTGNSTTTVTKTLTTEGQQIKHGVNAKEPVIRGNVFGAQVINKLAAAGSVLSTTGNAATIALIPDVFTGSPTGATVGAVESMAAAMTAVGNLLGAAASAYASTLSKKVKTE